MAGRVIKWTASNLKLASEAARLINRGVNRLARANKALGIYDYVPENVTSEYIRMHVNTKADLDAWLERGRSMTVKHGKKKGIEFMSVEVDGQRMTIPVAEVYGGRSMPMSEAVSARREQKRQDRRARRLKKQHGRTELDGEQFQEWGKGEFMPGDVFSNNVNIESHFEKYLAVIAQYDDLGVLSETVDIVNWLLEKAIGALKRIYESGDEIPQIEFIYWQLVHYQQARKRAAKGVKARKTKTGLSTEANALNSLNRINRWWMQQFHQQTGNRWAEYE